MPQSFGSRLGPAFIFCVYATFGCQSSEVALPKVDLDAVLLTAAAGDVIELGPHSYEGSFEVPEGVTLRGGPETRLIAKEEDMVVLNLIPAKEEDRPTKVESVTIESGKLAINAEGTGYIEILKTSIKTPTGAGIHLKGVTGKIKESKLAGAVDGPNSDKLMLGETFSSDSVSVIGIAMVNADVQLEKVDIEGYVGFGAVAYQSNVVWKEGMVRWIVGAGFLNEAGTALLEGLTFKEGLQSKDILGKRNGFGIVSSKEASTDTTSVHIESMMGMGLVAYESVSGRHLGLSVVDSSSYGVHIQGKEEDRTVKSGAVQALSFETLSLVANSMAGVSILAKSTVTIDNDSLISDTVAYGAGISMDDVVLGHGIQLAGQSAQLQLDTVSVLDNDIIGILLDGEETLLEASDVFVGLVEKECDATYAHCYAVHAQNGASTEGFSSGVAKGSGFLELDPSIVLPKTEKEAMPSISKLAEWSPAKEALAKEIEISPSGINLKEID